MKSPIPAHWFAVPLLLAAPIRLLGDGGSWTVFETAQSNGHMLSEVAAPAPAAEPSISARQAPPPEMAHPARTGGPILPPLMAPQPAWKQEVRPETEPQAEPAAASETPSAASSPDGTPEGEK